MSLKWTVILCGIFENSNLNAQPKKWVREFDEDIWCRTAIEHYVIDRALLFYMALHVATRACQQDYENQADMPLGPRGDSRRMFQQKYGKDDLRQSLE